MSFVDRHFALAKRDTSPRLEIVGGITSFLAAAYLLVVIPSLLATGGMDRGAAIGISMFATLKQAHFEDFTDSLPVLSMVLLTLMANSFGTGIAGGLLVYVLVKALAGRFRDIPIGLVVLAIPLGYYFWTVVGGKH